MKFNIAAFLLIFLVMAASVMASSLSSTSTYTNPDGLMYYADMHTCTGTSVTDGSDFANTGTFVNSPTWNVGKYGCGLVFNGGTANLNTPSSTSLNSPTVTHQITISMWIYPTSLLTQTYPILVDKEYINGSNPEYIFMLRNNYKISFGWYGTTNDYWITSTNQVTTNNTWYYVAVTYNSVNSPIIYVNGIAVAGTWLFGSGESLSKSTTYPMFTGNYWDNSVPFNGTIDEVKIWNRALTTEEVYVDYLGTFDKITSYYTNSTAITSMNTTIINGFSNVTAFNQSTNNTLNQLANNATLNTVLIINNQTNSTTLIIGNVTNGTSVILGNLSGNSTTTNNLVKEVGENLTEHDVDIKDLINSLANLSEADLCYVWTSCSPRSLTSWTFAQEVWDNATAPTRTLTEASCSITVNQTNSTETYNYTYNNTFNNTEVLNYSYTYNYSTNSTINNTFNYPTSLTQDQLKAIAKTTWKYADQYQTEYDIQMAKEKSLYMVIEVIIGVEIISVIFIYWLLRSKRR